MRATFGPKTPLGKRRTGFAEAPEHDEAAIEEALVEREPITVVVSEKGWIRALRGTVTDLSGIAFKADDGLKFAFFAETTSKCLVFATNGRCYTLDAAKLPGGRGHGEPVRLYADMEQDAELVSAFRYQGGRKFLVASAQGRGFVVPEDECLGNTRKGKQVLNVKAPDEARASRRSRANSSPSIGENRKMVIFPLDQVPEMARGRGVRLQRYKDGGLSDIKTFKAGDGLTWIDSAGRSFKQSIKELAAWRGNRGDAGRVGPTVSSPTTSLAAARQRQRQRRGVSPVTCDEQNRSVGVLEYRRSGVAEIERVAGAPAHPMTMKSCCPRLAAARMARQGPRRTRSAGLDLVIVCGPRGRRSP